MEALFLIIYWPLGYWAVGQTIYANRIRIGTLEGLFLQRAVLGMLLGWILIPIALIQKIANRRKIQ